MIKMARPNNRNTRQTIEKPTKHLLLTTVQQLTSWYSDIQIATYIIDGGNVTYVCTCPCGADAINIYSVVGN